MQIDEIHKLFNRILKKEINGYVTPAEIDQFLHVASISRFNELAPFYAKDQQAQDDLAPFKKSYTFTNGTSPAGLVTFPDDYMRLLAMWPVAYDNDLMKTLTNGIEIVNDDELAERLMSQLRPVTVTKPMGQWAGKGKVQLYPQAANAGTVWYLKRPDAPEYVYTQAGRVFTYNDPVSVQLEWDDRNVVKVVIKALGLMGVPLSHDKLVEYAQIKDQIGV